MPRGFRNMQGQQGWATDKKLRFLIQGYPKKAAELGVTLSMIAGMDADTRYRTMTAIRQYADAKWSKKWYTSYSVFAEYLWAEGGTGRYSVKSAYRKIQPFLNQPQEMDGPFVFTKNPEYRGGNRIPLTWDEYDDNGRSLIEKKAMAQFSAVKAEVARKLDQREDQEDDIEQDENQNLDIEQDNEQDEQEQKQDIQIIDEENVAAKKCLLFLDNCREYCEDRRDPATGESLDAIGMRPYIDSAKLLAAKYPVDWICADVIQHWDHDAKTVMWELYKANQKYELRNRPKIESWDIDYSKFKGDPNVPGMRFITADHHHAMPAILTKAWQRIPILLHGPSGTGKSHITEDVADVLGKAIGTKFPHVLLPLTRATSPSAFYGKQKIDGTGVLIDYMQACAEGDMKKQVEIAKLARESKDVSVSLFQRVVHRGGVLNLDEIDAGDENLLLIVNGVMAQRKFANVLTGEIIDLHSDCFIFGCANTNGMGATRHHGARNRLDHSTLDRFRLGRFHITLDVKLAHREFNRIISAQ
jgi:MoxR-like ATPase